MIWTLKQNEVSILAYVNLSNLRNLPEKVLKQIAQILADEAFDDLVVIRPDTKLNGNKFYKIFLINNGLKRELSLTDRKLESVEYDYLQTFFGSKKLSRNLKDLPLIRVLKGKNREAQAMCLLPNGNVYIVRAILLKGDPPTVVEMWIQVGSKDFADREGLVYISTQ